MGPSEGGWLVSLSLLMVLSKVDPERRGFCGSEAVLASRVRMEENAGSSLMPFDRLVGSD